MEQVIKEIVKKASQDYYDIENELIKRYVRNSYLSGIPSEYVAAMLDTSIESIDLLYEKYDNE